MAYKSTWDLRSIPDPPFYAELSRRVSLMRYPHDIPDALKSIVGAVQAKQRMRNNGGRPIEPTSDPALAERRRKSRERVREWRNRQAS